MSDPNRILIVLPSWLGDVVMATPALRHIRTHLPGSFIGALARPGIDQLLKGTDLIDELHVDHAQGIMGPKRVAQKLRTRRYASALLLTNSFSTALVARLAWIPRRIGYDRDGRGFLLTDKLTPPRRDRPHRGFAPISAVQYYLDAAEVLTDVAPNDDVKLELPITPHQEETATELLHRAEVAHKPYVLLNPGANNPAKRWPSERFVELATHLSREHGFAILINGSPKERDLANKIRDALVAAGIHAASLPDLGVTIGALKHIIANARLVITNDTGPRHLAAAFAIPTISLFGPTDPRWTTLPQPTRGRREILLVADPTLPETEVADDHPDRCRIDRINTAAVIEAADTLLTPPRS